MRNAKLLDARHLTPSVRELTFDPGPGFSFIPGQWISFRIPSSDPEPVSRAYSIASGPRSDGLIQIAVTRIEHGPASGFLHQMSVGQSLEMSDAQGLFGLEDPSRPILMVATGTGISPFRSMLEGHLSSAKALPPTTVLLGARSEQDILFFDEFEQMARLAELRFICSLSRPSDSWSGLVGHVQSHIEPLVRAIGSPCDVYICGLGAMVRDVRAVLKQRLGFTRERIHSERFD